MATSECLYTFRHLIHKLINTGWTVKLAHDPPKCGRRARLMSEGPDKHLTRHAAPRLSLAQQHLGLLRIR